MNMTGNMLHENSALKTLADASQQKDRHEAKESTAAFNPSSYCLSSLDPLGA